MVVPHHVPIACIGECMVELSGIGHRPSVGMGGDSLNIAIYLSRVLDSVKVSYVTRLGDDPFSDQLVATMQTEGLDTTRIARIPQALPALYAITLIDGERSFHYWRDQAPARDLFKEPDLRLKSYLDKVGCMVVTGISLAVLGAAGRQRLLACAQGKDQRTCYVVNNRPTLWQSAKLARQVHDKAIARADYVLVSDDELVMLWLGKGGMQRLSRLCPGGGRADGR